MNAAEEELAQIAERLVTLAQRGDSAEIVDPLSSLQDSAERVGRSASGSWLGYHAFVYYEGLNTRPPDAHFDQQWGLEGSFGSRTSGSWVQYTREMVEAAIYGRAGDPDLGPAREFNDLARREVESCKSEVLSVLQTHITQDDPFLDDVRSKFHDVLLVGRQDVINKFVPRSTWTSYDDLAINQGQQTPPHIYVLAEVIAMKVTRETISKMIQLVRQTTSHISRQQTVLLPEAAVGTNVFIGHGRSVVWRELKDFIEDRLGLQTDEFNRVSVVGNTNTERLGEMLDTAAMAFLVMTAEDEQHDGKYHPRLNVVHEVGLFQGRLGFKRAIVLLEDGCEEFGNIAGLVQIRFSRGNVRSAFEDVRQVLEREGLVKSWRDRTRDRRLTLRP